MHFDLKKPCENCPFLRKGGVRLTAARVEEIASGMLDGQGRTFACHKTTIDCEDEEGCGDRKEGPNTRHCAGALIFAEKNGNATQMMRIMERLRAYDPRSLMKDREAVESVFDDLEEMLEANEDFERPRGRSRESDSSKGRKKT